MRQVVFRMFFFSFLATVELFTTPSLASETRAGHWVSTTPPNHLTDTLAWYVSQKLFSDFRICMDAMCSSLNMRTSVSAQVCVHAVAQSTDFILR